VQATVQALHGLVSCAEWTGVPLSTLLEETGIDPKAKWIVAEGADSLALHRSVPLPKALDDAMIALYQNGERLMPGNGYPMRLLLPGWEGNMNVKFLRRIKLVEQPVMSTAFEIADAMGSPSRVRPRVDRGAGAGRLLARSAPARQRGGYWVNLRRQTSLLSRSLVRRSSRYASALASFAPRLARNLTQSHPVQLT